MKKRILLFALMVLLCLLMVGGGAALAQPGGMAADSARAGQAVAPNGGYHLSELSWRVSGAASGGGYILRGPAPEQGAGCCCTYLPCVPRDLP